jgi:uncharacterized damage-inducible protein DinB
MMGTQRGAEPARQLEEALAVGEDSLGRIRHFLTRVTQPESERKPDPAAWSIGEIAHHLVLVIRRPGVRCTEIIAAEPPDRFQYAEVVAKRRFSLPDVADVAKGGKGVAPEAVRPTAGGDIRKLAEELAAAWEGTKAALRPLRDRDLSRHYYEHYRLGPLNLYEYVAFQGYHALKHLAQMRRTLAAVRYDATVALIDEARHKVLALLDAVTQAEADRRPGENEWSVGEVAHHIALWECDAMRKLADAAATAKPNEYEHEEVLRKRPYRVEDSWDVSLTGKGKHLPEWTPTPGRPLPDLRQDLEAARARTKQMLGPFREQDLSVKFVSHHRLGPLTIYERLAFAAYHDTKHLQQMERALAAVRRKD